MRASPNQALRAWSETGVRDARVELSLEVLEVAATAADGFLLGVVREDPESSGPGDSVVGGGHAGGRWR